MAARGKDGWYWVNIALKVNFTRLLPGIKDDAIEPSLC